MSVWWFQGQQDMLLTDNCRGENELVIIMNSRESSDNLRWVGRGEKHSLGNWDIGVLSLWWVWVLFCHLDMWSRGFLGIPEQIKSHCSWILHVSSILDLLLLLISISLVIQVMQTAVYCQNVICRKWNKLHPKKQCHHSCGMLVTIPHIFKPIPVFVKWRQLCYSSFLMNLWPECMLSVEHNLAHSRCSLSGDGCGCHGDGCDEGFHAKSNRWVGISCKREVGGDLSRQPPLLSLLQKTQWLESRL